jgi:uncharacterized protein (DUF1800 family)
MQLGIKLLFTSLLLQTTILGQTFAVNIDEARHLLSRTTFGGSWAEIQALSNEDYTGAVKHLLDQARPQPQTSSPDWVNQPLFPGKKRKQLSEVERKELRQELRRRAMDLKAWWFKEMVQTNSPISEQMTLFWHNHFTSSLRKVKFPSLLYCQNLLLREHALGNFRELLHAVARDPAMIMYLDNVSNIKGKPNENFARELLELFTLGEGHYTERDIKEAARAFTGWSIDRRKGRYRFVRRRHDYGTKTFMGHTGNFNGNDIIDIVLDQPDVAVYVTKKFWRNFISGPPDEDEIKRLANFFRSNNYEIKPLMRALLTSNYFRNSRQYGSMIKSPVELLVGTLRIFQIPIGRGYGLAMASRRLGQDLMDPPNVKGWEGDTSWITTDTLLARQQILSRFLRGKEMASGRKIKAGRMVARKSMPDKFISEFGQDYSEEEITRVLLAIPPVEPNDPKGNRQEMITELLLDPVYQLK